MWDGLPRGSRTSHSTSLPGLECRLLCTISSCAVRASPNKALPVTWRSLSRRSVASARLYAQIKNQRHRLCSEAVNESKYWMHYAACSGQYAFAADEARLALSNSSCSQSSTSTFWLVISAQDCITAKTRKRMCNIHKQILLQVQNLPRLWQLCASAHGSTVTWRLIPVAEETTKTICTNLQAAYNVFGNLSKEQSSQGTTRGSHFESCKHKLQRTDKAVCFGSIDDDIYLIWKIKELL